MSNFRFNTTQFPLTRAEEHIVDYIYKNLGSLPLISINDLAQKLNISVATLSRFVRHMGFSNYKAMKAAIYDAEGPASPASKLRTTIEKNEALSPNMLLKKQEADLARTRAELDEAAFEDAVVALAAAKRIFLFGKGAAGALVTLAAFRLNRFHKQVISMHASGSELFEDLVQLEPSDLVLAFAFNPLPEEARVLLEHAREIGSTVILVSDRLYVPELHPQISLYVCRGDLNEYHAMSGAVALVDALVILLAERLEPDAISHLNSLHFLKEQYSSRIRR